MRLVCPNCEAKYEVPEDAIPETGRDVQCANCGHSWYQMRPRAAVAEAPVAAAPAAVPVAAPVAAAPVAAPVPTPAAAPEVPVEASAPQVVTEPEAVVPASADPAPVEAADVPDAAVDMVEAAPLAAAPVPADDTEPAFADEMPATGEPAAAETVSEERAADGVVAPAAVAENLPDPEPEVAEVPAEPVVAAGAAAAYAVDDSVLAILREEAEREARARKAEVAKPLETQTELGIEQAVPEVSLPHQPVYEDASLAARRARLPDVEEINSTLRPTESAVDEPADDTSLVAAEGRSSFRSGFLMVLTVAILGSAVYGSADAIAEAVPALTGVLKSYVGFVDSLRLQLDGLMQSATVAINGT